MKDLLLHWLFCALIALALFCANEVHERQKKASGPTHHWISECVYRQDAGCDCTLREEFR